MSISSSAPFSVIRFPINANYLVRTMGHVRYDAPWKHFPRQSDDYILYFIESGDLYVEEDGVRYHLEENNTLLLEPHKFHTGYQEACVSYYYIHFSCSTPMEAALLTDALKEHIRQLRMVLLDTEPDYIWEPSPHDFEDLYFPKQAQLGSSFDYFQALRDADQIFFEGLEGRRSLLSLKLQEILTMLCREFSYYCVNPNYTKNMIVVRHIRFFISDNYAKPITSKNISATFHINYDYANRLFKAHVGHSIHDYLIITRIHHAKQFITSGMSVSEAAALVGIDDAAYFSRLFKKITGISPSEYAKRNYRVTRE